MFTTLSALFIVFLVAFLFYREGNGSRKRLLFGSVLGFVGALLIALIVWNATVLIFKVLLVGVLVGLLVLALRAGT